MNAKTLVVLNDLGVDKIAYFYRSTPLVDNAYTTCLLINSEKGRIEARGISICSVLDPYNKNTGKQKSMGRAIKALVRRQNFDKINPGARDKETVKREAKLKTEEAITKFKTEKVPELATIDPDAEVTVIEGTGPGDKFLLKYQYEIPLSYPIRLASENFRYKAQFRPNPAGREEADILNSLEEEKAI